MPDAKQGLRLDLRTLILVLAALTAIVMLLTSYFASFRVQRQLLIDHSLEANRVYAAKLASITDLFISGAQQQLSYSASTQAQRSAVPGATLAETERLMRQTQAFNSVFVVDAQGVMQAISPAPLHGLVGKHLESPGAIEALRERRPLVSMPFQSAANNLVVMLSQPVFDAQGRYQGYVGGTLYLRNHNILKTLLGEHFYQDGSYLYVVDRNRRVLYHPDPQRVGTLEDDNPLMDSMAAQGNGALRGFDGQGQEQLAGFASVPNVDWRIVAQQPLALTVAPSQRLMLNVVGISIPLAVLGGILLWWLALIVARPLWALAASAHEMDQADTLVRLRGVRAWYYEAAELKRALLFGFNLLQDRIGRLHRDVQTDPLTGLENRRGLDISLALLQAEGRAFCAIVLDVDHFKRINDGHGHDVGDQVLRQLAERMRACCREGDVLCRTGGEEFLMLLPGAPLERAHAVAERLRNVVQDRPIEPVGTVTISLGVACWPGGDVAPQQTLNQADRALYQAKHTGRNRVCVAQAC